MAYYQKVTDDKRAKNGGHHRGTIQHRPGNRCSRCTVEFCEQYPVYFDAQGNQTDYCIGCRERDLAKRGDYSYLGDVCDDAPRRGDGVWHHIIMPTRTRRGAA